MGELQKIARECNGIDRPAKDIDDWCNSLWGKPSSPSIRLKRHDRVNVIQETLAGLEGTLSSSERRDAAEPSIKRRKLGHVTQNVDPRMSMKSEQQRAKIAGGQTKTSEQHNMARGTDAVGPSDEDQDQSTRVAVHEAHTGVQQNSQAIVSCFMKSSANQNCVGCLRWKKAITKDRRVHSLESLLIGCGAGPGPTNIGQGLIFVHSDDTATLSSAVKRVQERSQNIDSQILVFGCNTDKLGEENALFVF
jgi:hypothetical protein